MTYKYSDKMNNITTYYEINYNPCSIRTNKNTDRLYLINVIRGRIEVTNTLFDQYDVYAVESTFILFQDDTCYYPANTQRRFEQTKR